MVTGTSRGHTFQLVGFTSTADAIGSSVDAHKWQYIGLFMRTSYYLLGKYYK